MINKDRELLDEFGLGYEAENQRNPDKPTSTLNSSSGINNDVLNRLHEALKNQPGPIQKKIKSPYRDSTQIGIECIGTALPLFPARRRLKR